MDDNHNPDHIAVDKIARLAQQAAKGSTLATAGGREFLLVPDGVRQVEVTDPHGLTPGVPARVKQAVTVQTEASLGDYVNRFKTLRTVLFADVEHNRILAVIDYHAASDGTSEGRADNADHKASLELPFSEEWKDWKKVDGAMMSQLDFARFIEENRADIAAPSAAELLDVCRDLHAVRNVDFKKAVRTASENESFEFSDDTQLRTRGGTNTLEVPTEFLLMIPVYFGGRSVEVVANLRWKLGDNGQLQLGVKLRRAEHVRQAVFKEVVDGVAAATDRPAVFGRP